MKIENIVFGWK